MAKRKVKTKEKIIKIVIEKRVEPLKVPDIKVRDFSVADKIFFCN